MQGRPYLLVVYAEYRPATYDPNVPIGERQEHRIHADGDAAMEEYEEFMSQGAVQIGGRLYKRQPIGHPELRHGFPAPTQLNFRLFAQERENVGEVA